jgi:tRNA (guanine-N7-)-methyltransferase
MKRDDRKTGGKGLAFRLEELPPDFHSLELEIGPGKGRFLLARAANRPDSLFLGIEIRAKAAGIMEARARKLGLKNVVVLRDDVRNVFRDLVESRDVFDRIFIHFPDPWWKRRHERRYLAKEDVMEAAARTLKPGGELFYQTDVFARAGEVLRLLAEHALLENLDPHGGFLESSPFVETTAREEVCRELGLPVFRLHFRKKRESVRGDGQCRQSSSPAGDVSDPTPEQ